MKFKSIYIILICLLPLSLIAQSSKTPIAVIDFESAEISESANIALSNIIRKELITTDQFDVVDRNNMNEILAEQGFQQTGLCTDLACIVEVGKLLGVRKMIGGSIGLLGKKYIVDLKIVDVETGRIDKIETSNYIGPIEELDNTISDLTYKLVDIKNKINNESRIFISSKPSGAQVLINSILIGNTPLKHAISPETDYIVQVTSDGYSLWQQKVNVKSGLTKYLEATLIKSGQNENSLYLNNLNISSSNNALPKQIYSIGMNIDFDPTISYGFSFGLKISENIGLDFQANYGTFEITDGTVLLSEYLIGPYLAISSKAFLILMAGYVTHEHEWDEDYIDNGSSLSFLCTLPFALSKNFYLAPQIGWRLHPGVGVFGLNLLYAVK